MLRHRVEIDPDRVGPVLDLAAVGIVNSVWRNSPVEAWHADGRLHDGDMLRVNALSDPGTWASSGGAATSLSASGGARKS